VNAWDFVTWLSAVALGASAVVIFGFFLRDARSILSREMHDSGEESESSSASGSAAGAARPAPSEDPRER
jgi:hypothetical protein